jgi:hypothetical protein
MENFKELFEKAKKPKIYQELTEWTKIMYPDVEVLDFPNWVSYHSKKKIGQTTFQFKSPSEAQKYIADLKNTKYGTIRTDWAGDGVMVPWIN